MTSDAGKDEQQGLHSLQVGMQNGPITWEESLVVSYKLNTH